MLYDVFILGVTFLSIHLISTVPERIFILVVIGLTLHFLSRYLGSVKKKKLASVIVAGVITLPVSLHLYTTFLKFFPVIFAVIVLILFLLCISWSYTKKKKLVLAFVAGLISLLISSTVLTDIHRFLFADQAVLKFSKGQFNNLGLDTDRRILYAIGEGINHIHAYNIDALDAPPVLSALETGRAETAFLFDARAKEIFNLNPGTRQLNILDSSSLTLKKSIPLQISPGGYWIAMDSQTGYVIVASESRGIGERDISTVVLDRHTGKIVKMLLLNPGNILLHPTRPVLYMNYFLKSSNEVIVYDLNALEISNKTRINARMDRMAFLESANELLVTLPTKSIIYRMDSNTLALKGKIKSSFGVRTLAVDSERNLLLTVSLVTNILDVIDLNTYRSIKRYYLAPWLRSIVLDGKGTAYVSCLTGLFRVNYAK
jgi:hypothetical protein